MLFKPHTGTETTGLNGSNFICLASLPILSNSKHTANGLWFSWPQNIFLVGSNYTLFFLLLFTENAKSIIAGPSSVKKQIYKDVKNLFEGFGGLYQTA